MIKKAWLNEISRDCFSLSLESANPEIPIYTNQLTFPDKPTPTHPKRHTINIGVFDKDDLLKIKSIIEEYL